MVQERFKVTKYKDKPEWDCLEVNNKYDQWTFMSHSNGDVEIECYDSSLESKHLFLDQDELKQVIEFLQSKVK